MRITPAYAGKSLSADRLSVRSGDHPRVCGEKFLVFRSCALLGRITPAYAGKSLTQHTPITKPWDHPRVCGEKSQCRVPTAISSGSPPRMRGKDVHQSESEKPHGITPAYAGKRCRLTVCLLRIRDHPRVCGEKLFCCKKGLL